MSVYGVSPMSGKKRVLFLFEDSPASHLRFFEGMRMALGFSVTHPQMELLLLGSAVQAIRHFRPEEIGLPREMLEFFPLFIDLGVRMFADARRSGAGRENRFTRLLIRSRSPRERPPESSGPPPHP